MSFLANWIYVTFLLEGVYTQRRHPINEWRLLQDTNEVLSWILAWGAHISVDRREIWHTAFEVHLMRPIVHTRTFLSIPLPLGNVFPNCLKDPAIIMVLFPSKNLPPTPTPSSSHLRRHLKVLAASPAHSTQEALLLL